MITTFRPICRKFALIINVTKKLLDYENKFYSIKEPLSNRFAIGYDDGDGSTCRRYPRHEI